MEIGRTKLVPLVGLNYKDKNSDAVGFLKGLGDPYEMSLSDTNGRVGIDLGVYGVPETFVIDKQGVLRYARRGNAFGDRPTPDDIVGELRKLR